MTSPGVAAGMRAQLARRDAELAEGAEPLGWKIGINVPAVQERLGIDAPVVGYMTSRSPVEPGGQADVSGWSTPMLEPEVAIRVGEDGRAASLAPAIELVDVDLPFDDVEAILAGNIFHRAVVLGDERPRDSAAGRCRVLVDGEEAATVPVECDVEGTIAHVAAFLELYGARLSPGEVIIAGSLTAPLPVTPGSRIEVEVGELGAVSVNT
jgi:2-oxo-3-hexenedioate decarboxylase